VTTLWQGGREKKNGGGVLNTGLKTIRKRKKHILHLPRWEKLRERLGRSVSSRRSNRSAPKKKIINYFQAEKGQFRSVPLPAAVSPKKIKVKLRINDQGKKGKRY